jgi:hypothetical protein
MPSTASREAGQDAGVVERDVQASVGLDGRLDQAFNVGCHGHVGPHEPGGVALLLDEADGLSRPVVDVADDDRGALPGEGQ